MVTVLLTLGGLRFVIKTKIENSACQVAMGTVKYNMTYFKMIQVSLLVHCSGCFNGLYALLLTRPVHH